MLGKLFQSWTGSSQLLANHALNAVVQSAAVVDAGGVVGVAATDNYEKPVPSVYISGRKWPVNIFWPKWSFSVEKFFVDILRFQTNN